MGRVIEKITITNYVDTIKVKEGSIKKTAIRKIELDGLIDTGATFVCISKDDIKKLGLPFHRNVKIKTGNGKVTRKTYGGALIELKGRDLQLEIMENHKDAPALIGYLLLEALDLVIDPKAQKVIPNPEHGGQWIVDGF